MESQMERRVKMWRKIFACLVIGFCLNSQNVFSSEVMDIDTLNGINADNQVSNQVLLYRMLNSKTKNPEDISYYRYWKKERKLEWLSNHKNLRIPGMIDDEDTEAY